MERFIENSLVFFDSITLFVDYWKKKSDLDIRFVFSCFPGETKAVINFRGTNEEHLAVFKQHLLRHFETKDICTKIAFCPETVEIFMKDWELQRDQTTSPSLRVPYPFNHCTQVTGQHTLIY